MRQALGAAVTALAMVAALVACSGASHIQEAAGRSPLYGSTASPLPSSTPSSAHARSTPSSAHPRDFAVNLPATPALRRALLRAYVAARTDVRQEEVSGPRRGTLYYAYETRTRTYWAIAWFDPSSRARYQTQVNFQDGMGGGVFVRTAAHHWRAIVHERDNLPCPGDVPPAVLRAWRLRAQDCAL